MKVKEFIKTILKDVTEAVEESTKESETYGFSTYEGGDDKKIKFDLAIVLKEGGMEISTIEPESQKSISGELIHRIKFSILPTKKPR